MNRKKIDLGFIPVGVPGSSGSGSVRTSTLLIEKLADIHDMTVYILAKEHETINELPRSDTVEYNVIRYNKFQHPQYNRRKALKRSISNFENHELVHSYSCGFLPELEKVNVPVIMTLNSYLPVCPKDSLIYHDGTNCDGPRISKCSSCIVKSKEYIQSPKSAMEHLYYQIGSLDYVVDSLSSHENIDAFHALAPHLEDKYGKIGFDRDKITTIPHYYDNQFISEGKQLNDPIELLYVGKISKRKGVNVIPGALSKLDLDFKLKIAGVGSQEDSMRDEFEQYRICDNVQFLGYVDYDNIPTIYEGADIFLYPGRWAEPFGRIFLEAMASRTPVVATDVGSAKYILGDAGVVYSTAEYEQKLAEGITKIVSSYGQYVDACSQELKRFRPEFVIEQFNDLYQDVMTENN